MAEKCTRTTEVYNKHTHSHIHKQTHTHTRAYLHTSIE